MNIVGDDYLRRCISAEGYCVKLVFNARSAYFFPHTMEHRDASLPGLCYRDDSTGDALAATIKTSQIDIRLHRTFSPSQVMSIVKRIEIAIGNSNVALPFEVNYGSEYLTTIKVNTYDHSNGSLCDPLSFNDCETNNPLERSGGSSVSGVDASSTSLGDRPRQKEFF